MATVGMRDLRRALRCVARDLATCFSSLSTLAMRSWIRLRSVSSLVSPGPREIVEHSTGSSIVFLPFRLGDDGPQSVFGGKLSEYVPILGVTAIVLASHDVPLDAEPESGVHGEIAEAVDTARQAERSLVQVEKDAVLYYTEAFMANKKKRAREALSRLIDEEKGHVVEIQKRLDNLRKKAKKE